METTDNGFREIAERATILRCTVGSGLHGLQLKGTDDDDEMGVCIEPAEYVIGLQHFEQWVYRTKPEGVRSEAGDLDLTIYSLRKYMRLAASGNPTILLPLFAPESELIVCAGPGHQLRDLAPEIVSLRAGEAFKGYLTAQKQRLLGERGQMRVNRPELIAAHGFDTKYAMHMLRLGVQGVELLRTGRITLPVPERERSEIMAVRRGERTLQQITTWAGELEAELDDLIDGGSPLPPQANAGAIDTFLVGAYTAQWTEPADH